MSRAVFLDRDGVINKERKDYVKNLDEFEIFNGVSKAIKILKEKNFLVIIITNQSAINRNLLTTDRLDEIHNYLQEILKKDNTAFDAIYYCPHKPEENCDCRKPKPGMLFQAQFDFDFKMEKTFFIGDDERDKSAAKKAGCKPILIKGNDRLDLIVKQLFD